MSQDLEKSKEWLTFRELVAATPFGRNEVDKLVKAGVFKPLKNPLVKNKGVRGAKRMFRRSSIEDVLRRIEAGENVLPPSGFMKIAADMTRPREAHA